MKKHVVLIDGDYLAFRVAAGKDEFPLDEIIELLDTEINGILYDCSEAFGGTDVEYIVFLSGYNNNRKIKYPEYKANRKGEKPLHLSNLRLQLAAFWNGVTVEGIEADDAIGICANYLPSEDTIIATADKDFAQMQDVWIYDIYPARAEKPRKEGQPYIAKELTEDGVWYRTDRISANKQLAYQLIYGDSGDNVKGLTQYQGKRRGHKKAALERLFSVGESDGWDRRSLCETACSIYEEEFGEEEGGQEYQKTFDLVYIQREYCDDFKEIPETKTWTRN